jgi:hypothetical protein
MKANQTKSIGTSMFIARCWMLNVALLATAGSALAGVHYVDVNSTNATPPYTNWTTAATNIQDAVDAAVAGDEVVVTNGLYATGGSAVYGLMTNRVAVSKPLSLRSVNGPQFTIIQGMSAPTGGDGDGAIRCVYLTNGANLSGFTLTNGATRVVNDPPTYPESSGGGIWCESANTVVVSNCVIAGNSGRHGGGAYYSALNNCTLTGNHGGGAWYSTLNNCALTGNSGGGAWYSTLNNCALTDNSGGGAWYNTLNNCIVYFNAGGNYLGCTLNYCCTTPLPAGGIGNISADPQLASVSHLSAASPCRGAGSAAYSAGTDIDGEAWLNPPSIGCDEYHADAFAGPLSAAITASSTNVTVGFTVAFTGFTEGRTAATSWDFGDGNTATNQLYASHAWAAGGDYAVVLRAYNQDHPGGISATVTVHVVTVVHYVAANSANPVAPYTSWTTAATSIQDAIAATEPGTTVVMVSDGSYGPINIPALMAVRSVNGPQFTTVDGRGASRCASLAASATLSGFTLANGSGLYGGGAQGGTLNNCTLTGNSAARGGGAFGTYEPAAYGGGAYGCTLNNCTLTGNSALGMGGGAYDCTLNNCMLTGNRAVGFWGTDYCYCWQGCAGGPICIGSYREGSGGGAAYSTLNNCTLTGNWATDRGGGAYQCTLNNSITFFNGGDNYLSSALYYCCTTPSPTNGFGNITNAPLFVDTTGWANLRMQPNSPCINAGNNSYVTGSTDLDGNLRIAGGTVDIGAYEFQSPASIISYAWLQQFGLPIDGSAVFTDPDGDGVDNYHEWLAGTNPTNRFSSPAQLTITPAATNLVLTWPTNAVGFTLQSTTNLVSPVVWSTNSPVPVVIYGQNTVTNPIAAPRQFYRLVQ